MDTMKVETGLLRDFPEFLGPMVVKELREGMRARRFVLPFLLVHVLMLVALFFDLAEVKNGSGGGGFINMISGGGFFGQNYYWATTCFMLILVVPLTGWNALQRELCGRNAELLLITRVTRWGMVGGLWLVMCLQGGLIFLTTLPYLLVRYMLIGGMDVLLTGVAVVTLLLMFVTANAGVIALSGFEAIIMRLVLGFFMGLAAVLSAEILVMSAFLASGSIFGSASDLVQMAFMFSAMCASTIYYLVIFLQIARAKVRLYELPWEPSLSNGLVILAIVSPLFLGMLAVGTMGWGAIPVALLTAWGLAKSDKGRSIQ